MRAYRGIWTTSVITVKDMSFVGGESEHDGKICLPFGRRGKEGGDSLCYMYEFRRKGIAAEINVQSFRGRDVLAVGVVEVE
jgi:hypothetical protein